MTDEYVFALGVAVPADADEGGVWVVLAGVAHAASATARPKNSNDLIILWNGGGAK